MNRPEISTEILIVTDSRRQSFDADEITFRNQSADDVTINRHLVLSAGQSFTLGAIGEGIDTTQYQFQIPSKSGNLVVIARKLSH